MNYKEMTRKFQEIRMETQQLACSKGIPCTETFMDDYPMTSFRMNIKAALVKYPELKNEPNR